MSHLKSWVWNNRASSNEVDTVYNFKPSCCPRFLVYQKLEISKCSFCSSLNVFFKNIFLRESIEIYSNNSIPETWISSQDVIFFNFYPVTCAKELGTSTLYQRVHSTIHENSMWCNVIF